MPRGRRPSQSPDEPAGHLGSAPPDARLRLLIVEDLEEDADLLVAELRRSGYDPVWTRVQTPQDFAAALEDEPQIVLCDYSLPAMTAPDALAILKGQGSDVPLIVVSGVMDEETCVTSLRLGAVDYLLKDRLVRLGPSIEHALRTRRLSAAAAQARLERRETADILRAVISHAPAAICVRDIGGAPLLSNLEYQRLDLAVSQEIPDVSDVPGETEETFVVGGEERTYLCVRYPVTDEVGRCFAGGTIYVDITRHKHVEHELRELDRLKGEFVATVSHELRTPLTSIYGYTELLLDEMLPAPEQAEPVPRQTSGKPMAERRMIEVIDRNSRRLLTLVDDLLTLSRVDSGAGAGDEPVDVAELIASALTVVGPGAAAGQLQVVTGLSDGCLAVTGDRGQLERVMINLLSNAVKFSAPQSTVTVLARPGEQDGEIEIDVCDTGIGIAADELPQLFTRFYRTKRARELAIQGTGLGLAVVREIVERHGGRVRIASAPGRGTTVTLCLPLRLPLGTAPACG